VMCAVQKIAGHWSPSLCAMIIIELLPRYFNASEMGKQGYQATIFPSTRRTWRRKMANTLQHMAFVAACKAEQRGIHTLSQSNHFEQFAHFCRVEQLLYLGGERQVSARLLGRG